MRKKNVTEVKKWKKSNGNGCFSLAMCGLFENMWLNIFALILGVVICGLEFWFNKSLYSLVPILVLYLVCFLWWMGVPERDKDAIVSKVVHEIMDDIVKEDANAVGANVVKSIVNHDTKGTYGVIVASCLLVLLDNGEVWEYPLVYHKPEVDCAYYECERNHVVSENKQHIRKINPKRWNRFIECLKLSEKTRLGLLLTIVLVFGGLVFVGFCYLVIHFKWQYVLVLSGYVGIRLLMEWLSRRITSRFLNILKKVISLPGTVFYLLLKSLMPFLTIIGAYFFVALFAFGFPAAVLFWFAYFGLWELKLRTIIFVVFTVGSIICTHFYRITKWMIRSTPLRDWGNHTYESYREQLAIYLIHPSNMMFLLYLLYFVFLGISGYLQIEKDSYLITQGIDTAILKAFLVFIAFTNMRVKAKDAELDVRELYQRTLQLFVHDA